MPLSLDFCGYHVDLSGLGAGCSVCLSDDGGRLSLSLVEAQAIEPASVDAVQAAPEQAEVSQVAAVAQAAETVGEHVPALAEQTAAVHAEQPEQLFQQLAALRKQIASEVRLPPYIIFHDSTLREMCRVLPSSLSELKAIQGVGQSKLDKYGMRFIQAIQAMKGAA